MPYYFSGSRDIEKFENCGVFYHVSPSAIVEKLAEKVVVLQNN
jgi:hypothetical protein